MKKRYDEPKAEFIKYEIEESLLFSKEDDELPFVPNPTNSNTP